MAGGKEECPTACGQDWIIPCLLADLMMMILNWNKTDGGCNGLICV